jgi:hypothetical protein
VSLQFDRGFSAMKPELRFSPKDIPAIALRYKYPSDESVNTLKVPVQNKGYLTREELGKVARWKAARNAPRILRNTEKEVEEITRLSLAANGERVRIESLLILTGVGWPMASVILHFFHKDPYPILDFRALWSAGLTMPSQYSFPFWWSYVEYCRGLARREKIDMRTLDRALWQYSKENQ